MSILTQPQYYKYKAEMEKLAVLLDDDATSDLEYRTATRRMDILQEVFKKHWKNFNERKNKMENQEKVARALTGWMNGKKQEPKPEWESLPEAVRAAYMEQAADAIAALGVSTT